jgi:hypothetical protein
MTLVKSLHSGDPDLIRNKLARCQLGNKPSALQLLFRLHLSAAHVCSCIYVIVHVTTCAGGSHVACSYVEVPNSYKQAVWMALF